LPLDPDSSISDIGAFYFHHIPQAISEYRFDQSFLEYLNVFPNPVVTTLNIEFKLNSNVVINNVDIKIFDLAGNIIYQNDIYSLIHPTEKIRITLNPQSFSQYNTGLLIFNLNINSKNVATEKIVIRK